MAPVRCPRCGTPNRAEARFCGNCGIQLLDLELLPGIHPGPRANFCDCCGSPLRPSWDTHLVEAAAEDATYFPNSVLETERKQLTVLFADIVGSTNLIAGRDPEEARALLDPLLRSMIQAVERYGGTVNQIQGDGIMALFGAPHYHEEHSLRACCAALHMHDQIAQSKSLQTEGAPRIRIGISTGSVLVAQIGSALHRNYNAFGEIIHLASRLQHMASPGATLCSGETIRQTDGLVRAATIGRTKLRGIASPIEVFELKGASSHAIRFHARAAYGLLPLVGRAAEQAILVRDMELAGQGHGRTVGLRGEAGVGKSRLIWELTHPPGAEGWRVLEASGVSFGRHIPHLPIAGLLKSLFSISDHDDADAVEAKYRRVLDELGVWLGPANAALRSLLGIEAGDQEWTAIDPTRRREYLTNAFVTILCKQSAISPLLVVVEDLHWADGETRLLLRALARAITSLRVLLVVSYRPDSPPDWTDITPFRELTIAPLRRDEARQLTQHLLGREPRLERIHRALIERTAGNPFFIVESVRTLAEAGVLHGAPGAYQLAGESVEFRVPSSVRVVLGSRIDRLPVADKRLLQAASVIGTSFSLAVLASVMGELQEAVQSRLAQLESLGLLFESQLYPEIRYSFRHSLTQEVAYESLPQRRRQHLHAAVAQAMEQIYLARLPEHLEVISLHAFRGELWEMSIRYGRQAGNKSASQSAYNEAIAHFEMAIEATTHLLHLEWVRKEAIDIRFELRNSLFPLGQVAHDLEHMQVAEKLAKEWGDEHRLAWTSAYIARDLYMLGSPDQALSAGRHALDLAGHIADRNLQILVRSYIGQAYYALGDYRESANYLRRLVQEITPESADERFGLPAPGAVFFRVWLIWALARSGQFVEGSEQAETLLHIAETTNQPLALTVARYTRGFLLLHAGKPPAAILDLETSLSLCRQGGFAAWLTNIASALGCAYARCGDLARGIPLIEEAIRQTRSIGIMVSHSVEVMWLAEAFLCAGRIDEAWCEAKTALELAQRYHECGNQASACLVLGTIASKRGDLSGAQKQFEDALALARRCGMGPVLEQARLALAQLLAPAEAVTNLPPRYIV